ncbi:MAG: hydroxymethylglutaryl-CoA lyase, partial [Pseudomonadales bacterium]|nr:hydroxymethylglutaryl-CoA lyase [Pseudomonadales bacterium]
MLPTSVTVMEVSPRDGLQNEDVLVSTDDKLQLIDHALAAGSRRIEVTSFVHPQRVPQMADAEAVCAGLPERSDVRYTGLVLNERGYRRLRDTSLDEAGLVVPVSNTFGERNQGQSVADAVAMAREVIRDGKLTGFPVQVTLAVAFGCPFEGEVPLANLLAAAEALLEAGPVEIALADTIGVGVPWQVQQTFEALGKLAGDVPMRAHFHDTRNTGIGNAFG